ncbi:MAG: hypothetical protein WC725_05060 [Patescibacteria group bacterium]|jgi:hypothetical protein
MKYQIHKNSSHTATITPVGLEYDTPLECFNDFTNQPGKGKITQKTSAQLMADHLNLNEENEAMLSFDEYCGIYHTTAIDVMEAETIYQVNDDCDKNEIFCFKNEPTIYDYNEMLSYAYGSVTSPRGTENTYEIKPIPTINNNATTSRRNYDKN